MSEVMVYEFLLENGPIPFDSLNFSHDAIDQILRSCSILPTITHMEAYFERDDGKGRLYSLNKEWQQQCFQDDLMKNCHIVKYLKTIVPTLNTGTLIVPWAHLFPQTEAEIELQQLRAKLQINQGISLVGKIHGETVSLSLCSSHPNTCFLRAISNNFIRIKKCIKELMLVQMGNGY